MSKTLSGINSGNISAVPQTEKAHPLQKKNAAGGYTFVVDDVERLRRFLIIGTDKGTYYASEQELSKDNAKHVLKMAESNHRALVDTIVDVSLAGAAHRQDATLFSLAIAASYGTDEEKRYALSKLSDVARTGTHMFQFAGFVEQFRGWGRSLRRAVANWYTDKDVDALAYQMVKYRQRNGWAHRDLLRLSHPATTEQARRDLFAWAVNSSSVGEATPKLVEGFVKAQAATTPKEIVKLLGEYKLSWEMLPDFALTDAKVWNALLSNGVPLGALIRQLPRLTNLNLLKPLSSTLDDVVGKLTDAEYLKKSRIHPINVLGALRTYSSGRSLRGSSSWRPVGEVVTALDEAFYKTFDNVVPSGKRTLIGLDVSYSMNAKSDFSGLTARDISVAMSMITAATEPKTHTVGFTSGDRYSDGVTPVNISARKSLQENISLVSNLPFGGTDCALPIKYAIDNGIEVDTFLIITDNETWGGYEHSFKAIERYRKSTGMPAKQVAMGGTATDSTITNPEDPGSLSVVGFDPAVPKLIADFSRGL